jgi:hypothetical protein
MVKRIAICFAFMIVLYLFVCVAAAQADVLRVDAKGSTVLDKNTLEKWTLEAFERDGVKLLVGHDIEVTLVLHREMSNIPDSYYLELRTDLENPDWEYGGAHYKGSQVSVWNSSAEHSISSMEIMLTAKVPDSLIIDVEELGRGVKGIGEKKYSIELTIYNGDTLVGSLKETEFFATSTELIETEAKMEENIAEAHKKGITYPALESRIRNLFKNGNPEKALDLSVEYTKIVPHKPDHTPFGVYAILFIVGLAMGAVSSFFVVKAGEKGSDRRLQKLVKVHEKVANTTEKIRTIETKEADTSKKREFRNVREDLEEVESEIKRALKK